MRWVYLALLLVIIGLVAVFIVQNREDTTVQLFNHSLTAPLAWIFVAAYFLGMWSGGTVVGFIKRTYQHAAAADNRSSRSS